MKALFIGQSYIDVTFLTDQLPTGDEKTIARDYAVSFGGNAVTAAFACAKLGLVPDLLCSMANDWLARMFLDMAAQYDISVHHRKVQESSLSFIMPNNGKRAIVRCRDDNYLHPFPTLTLDGCKGLHIDGHQPDAALHYAQECRKRSMLTSLDGGAVRDNTDEVLRHIDVAVVSERFCDMLGMGEGATLDYLRAAGCKVGGVTLGEKGLVYYTGSDKPATMASLPIPADKVVDTNGAGDIFHGAYMYAALSRPDGKWEDHFAFARAASAHAIQHLGNEDSLPTLEDIDAVRQDYEDKA